MFQQTMYATIATSRVTYKGTALRLITRPVTIATSLVTWLVTVLTRWTTPVVVISVARSAICPVTALVTRMMHATGEQSYFLRMSHIPSQLCTICKSLKSAVLLGGNRITIPRGSDILLGNSFITAL